MSRVFECVQLFAAAAAGGPKKVGDGEPEEDEAHGDSGEFVGLAGAGVKVGSSGPDAGRGKQSNEGEEEAGNLQPEDAAGAAGGTEDRGGETTGSFAEAAPRAGGYPLIAMGLRGTGY